MKTKPDGHIGDKTSLTRIKPDKEKRNKILFQKETSPPSIYL
jgi:hypothetical protein